MELTFEKIENEEIELKKYDVRGEIVEAKSEIAAARKVIGRVINTRDNIYYGVDTERFYCVMEI